MKKTCIILSLVVTLCCGGCFMQDDERPSTIEEEKKLTVSLVLDEHSRVDGDNPCRVSRGGTAVFHLVFDEGYGLSADLVTYGTCDPANSIITIADVQYSVSYPFQAVRIGDLKVMIENVRDPGSVRLSPSKAGYDAGETVTVETTDEEFMCYTFDHPYRDDNRYKPASLPSSFASRFSFVIEHDVTLFINYFTEGLLRFTYDANGGVTIDGEEVIEIDYDIRPPHLDPQTLLGSYYLHRDGHTLSSYNTKADGTGLRVGIGSKIGLENAIDNSLTLYAQWEQWTDAEDFTIIELADGTCEIVKYIGSADCEKIVIPAVIGDLAVMGIGEGAFNDCSLTELILPPTLEYVKTGAFQNCPALETLQSYSSLKEIHDDSFDPNNLHTIRLNSNCYCDNHGFGASPDLTFQIDHIRRMEQRKIIFIGTSTTRMNQSLAPLEEKHPRFNYYLFGAIAGTDAFFIASLLCPYLRPDDRIVLSFDERSMCTPKLNGGNIVYVEFDLDLITALDYQNIRRSFFPSLMKYANAENWHSEIGSAYYLAERGSPTDPRYGMPFFGTLPEDEKNVNPDSSQRFTKAYFQRYINPSTKVFEWFLPVMQSFKEAGARLFGHWSSYNANSVDDDARDVMSEYETYIGGKYSVEDGPNVHFLNSILDNIYPGNMFCLNDNWHLTQEGCLKRAEQWAACAELFA